MDKNTENLNIFSVPESCKNSCSYSEISVLTNENKVETKRNKEYIKPRWAKVTKNIKLKK